MSYNKASLGCELSRSEFAGADPSRGVLECADLAASRISKAPPQQAHLEGADLSEARLEGANLAAGAISKAPTSARRISKTPTSAGRISKAPTSGGADGLTQAQIEAAYGDAATRLPEGLTRPAHWTAATGGGAAPAAQAARLTITPVMPHS